MCVADAPAGDLAYVHAMKAELIFVAAPGHPLASERAIAIERLAEFACAGPSLRGRTVSAFLGRRTDPHDLDAYTANDFEALMPLVLAGHAAMIAPAFFVHAALRSRDLVRLDVAFTAAETYGCYTTRAASFSPILARITAYAVELGDELQKTWRD